jgi:hypothetical protein
MVNAIVNNKDLLEKMKEFAKLDKDNPNPDKRGAQMFGKKEDPTISAQFHRLNLECILYWAKEFPTDSKK